MGQGKRYTSRPTVATSPQDKTMTYRQMQRQLKIYRHAGYTVPRLNSKKEVLANAIDEIETGKIPCNPSANLVHFDSAVMCQIFAEQGKQACLDYLATCGMAA